MRRPDVFTLDYSHPLAQGLVRAYFPLRGFFVDVLDNTQVQWILNPSVKYDTVLSQSYAVAKVKYLTPCDYISISADFISYYGIGIKSILCADKTFAPEARLFQARVNSDKINFIPFNASSLVSCTGDTSVDVGKKYSYCGTYDGSNAKVWLDGKLDGSASLSGPLRQVHASATPILFGYEQAQDYYIAKWDGEIGHVLVHNRALSPAEIAILADRTDPMLGGLIVEERPVLYYDIGGSMDVVGAAVFSASSAVGMGQKKGGIGAVSFSVTSSTGVAGVKGSDGACLFSAASSFLADGVKEYLSIDREVAAIFESASSFGVAGIKNILLGVAFSATSDFKVAGEQGILMPDLANAVGIGTDTHEAAGSVYTNKSGGTLYWIASLSATKPSVAQIQAGQTHLGVDADDSGSQAVSAAGTQEFTADGLSAWSVYYFHCQHKDAEGNESTVVTSLEFRTQDVSIALAFDDAAPAYLQGFLATSNLSMSDAELKALLDGE